MLGQEEVLVGSVTQLNTTTWETEAGRSQFRGQPGLYIYTARPCQQQDLVTSLLPLSESLPPILLAVKAQRSLKFREAGSGKVTLGSLPKFLCLPPPKCWPLRGCPWKPSNPKCYRLGENMKHRIPQVSVDIKEVPCTCPTCAPSWLPGRWGSAHLPEGVSGYSKERHLCSPPFPTIGPRAQ